VLEIVCELYADEPSNDWSTLCTTCDWTYTVHFNIGMGDWTAAPGNWVLGQGVVNDTGSAFPYAAQVNINVASWGTSELVNWRVNANSTTADTGAFRGAIFGVGGVFTLQDIGGAETGNYNLEAVASIAQPDLIAIQISNTSIPGTNTIISVTLTGIGDMPVWS